MHTILSDIPATTRESLAMILNQRLADAIDLMQQARQAHWNVQGEHFMTFHELFDRVYESVAEQVDLIAERVAQLGGVAQGTVQAAAHASKLPQYPDSISDGHAHIAALSASLASFAASVPGDIDRATALGDAGTADIFTEISREIDKHLWFVASHAMGA